MRKKVEAILGFPIPTHLEWMLQRLILQDHSAEQIAARIQHLINNPQLTQ